MTGFDILARGPLPARRVCARSVTSDRLTFPEWESSIEALWQEGLALSQREGRVLFDGPVLRLVEHRLLEDAAGLELLVAEGSYRDFYGTNLRQGHRLGPVAWDHYENPVGTSAVVITADGRAVLGRRSDHVMHYGGLGHCFGGTLEPRDRRADGEIDVEGSIRRELHEELGLEEADIERLDCLGLVRDHEIVQPELLFSANVSLELEALELRWLAASSRYEHSALIDWPHEPEAMRAAARQADVVAVAHAALLFLAESSPAQNPTPPRP